LKAIAGKKGAITFWGNNRKGEKREVEIHTKG